MQGTYRRVKVLSAVPLPALVVVDGSEPKERNLACMHSSMGKVCCSFVVAARPELAAVANTGLAVVAGAAEERAVEVDRSADVVASSDGSVPEMVLGRNCCGLLAAVDTIEEVKSAVGFGCNMPRLDLPCQASEAVPLVMVGIAGDSEAD